MHNDLIEVDELIFELADYKSDYSNVAAASARLAPKITTAIPIAEVHIELQKRNSPIRPPELHFFHRRPN